MTLFICQCSNWFRQVFLITTTTIILNWLLKRGFLSQRLVTCRWSLRPCFFGSVPRLSSSCIIFTARKRSLRRLCFYTYLSVILFTGEYLGRYPLAGTPPGRGTPPRQVHPPGRYPTWAGTPRARYTPGRYYQIRSMSRRYASYWNAFLFIFYLQIREKDQKSKFKVLLDRSKSLALYQEELRCDLSCILALEMMGLDGMWPSGYPGIKTFIPGSQSEIIARVSALMSKLFWTFRINI